MFRNRQGKNQNTMDAFSFHLQWAPLPSSFPLFLLFIDRGTKAAAYNMSINIQAFHIPISKAGTNDMIILL
jgi:hypothetical protein